MAVSFLATGVLFGVCVVLGAIYFILYNTHLSPASMRAREKRATMGGMGGGGGGGGHRKTQTHFTLFHPKGGGGGGGRGGAGGTKSRLWQGFLLLTHHITPCSSIHVFYSHIFALHEFVFVYFNLHPNTGKQKDVIYKSIRWSQTVLAIDYMNQTFDVEHRRKIHVMHILPITLNALLTFGW